MKEWAEVWQAFTQNFFFHWSQSYHNISSFRQKFLDLKKDSLRKTNITKALESWKTAWIFKNKTQALRPKFGLFYFSKPRQKISLSISCKDFFSHSIPFKKQLSRGIKFCLNLKKAFFAWSFPSSCSNVIWLC